MTYNEFRIWLIGILPRRLAVWLALRRLSPHGDNWPDASNQRKVPRLDTGGSLRPDWRKQNPSTDPKEPYGGESSNTGNDHGWSNCTMTSAALAYAFQMSDQSGPWGGEMRHKQDDMSGGTDLYDARTAWDRYGNQTLTIKSGAGWNAVKTAHNEGRAIIIQGEGNVPGSESFDGGHACCISPETHSDGRWLFGDPLASGWQWVQPGDIKTWAERLSNGIYFAVSKLPPPPPEPPEPEPPEPPPPPEAVPMFFWSIRRFLLPGGTAFYDKPNGKSLGGLLPDQTLEVTTLGGALNPAGVIDWDWLPVLVHSSLASKTGTREWKVLWIKHPGIDSLPGSADWPAVALDALNDYKVDNP